jgi:hypothetical protein
MSGFVENPTDVISKSRRNSQVGTVIHKFPKSEAIPYVMILGFKEYSYGDVYNGAGGAQTINKQSIVLPLPLQLNDTTGLEISSADGAMASTITGVLKKNIVDSKDRSADAQYYADIIQKTSAAVGVSLSASDNLFSQTIGKIALGTAAAVGFETGTTGSLLNGAAINPYETMEFKGVKLKTHSFSWRLSPSNKDDSDAIKNIVETIKQNILPSYIAVSGFGSAHNLLKYPHLVQISFLGIDQNYYYKLKPAFITSFNVRYNGGDQLNVFKGGKPVVVELAMELTEVNIHTAGDYNGVDQATSSGFAATVADDIINQGKSVINYVADSFVGRAN